MSIQFKNISESNLRNKVLIMEIEAKLSQVVEKQSKNGQTYGKFTLSRRNSKIVALAYEDTYIYVKNSLKIGQLIKFEPETFTCKLKDTAYNSDSTCKYDLTFRAGSNFIRKRKINNTIASIKKNKLNDNVTTLRKVAQLSKKSDSFTRKVNSIKFTGGEVYRYLGCKRCTRNIHLKHTDGKYYCNGVCNSNQPRRSKIGVVTERKVCITLNKKRGAVYPPTISVSMVRKAFKAIHTADSNYTVSTSVQHLNDALGYIDEEKDPVDPVPDFPEFDMKLRMTSVPYQKWKLKYNIASKPPGLVLLINNLNFPYKEEKLREGSQKDIDLLESGFRVMGYEIYDNKCQLDIKTKEDFWKLRDDFKNELIKTNADSCFIVISSHGIHSQVSLPGNENEFICIFKDIMIPFSDDNFPHFQGKPKVFMPITCQHIGSLTGERVQPSFDLQGNKLFDMIICGPCFPGYTQWRYSLYGTLYVNYLMRNLMEYATSWHFTQILDKVQDDFKQQILKHNIRKTAVPYFIANTFHQFYLVPKTDDDSADIEEMEVD